MRILVAVFTWFFTFLNNLRSLRNPRLEIESIIRPVFKKQSQSFDELRTGLSLREQSLSVVSPRIYSGG